VRIKEGISMPRKMKAKPNRKARKRAVAFAAASYQAQPTMTHLKRLLEALPKAKHRPMF
jgi:hypothetical protein